MEVDIRELLEEEIKNTLTDLRKNAQDAQVQITNFLDAIQPEIDQAILAGDLKTIDFIRDRISARMGRVSLGLIHKERMAVLTTITSILRVAIKLGLKAI